MMAYTNSPLTEVVILSPFKTKRKSAISKLTIHHMAGNLTVEQCGAVFQKAGRNASSNYGIGSDGRIALYVDESYRAWTSGNAENDHMAVTIEVANCGGAPDWPVSEKAYESMLRLCVDVCQRNNIKRINFTGDKSGNLTMHRWFQATLCPGPYLAQRFPAIADEINRRLEGDMTQAQFNEMMDVYLAALKAQPAQNYAKDALAWAAEQGIMVGDGNGNQQPMMFLAREDAALVQYRAEKRIADAIRDALDKMGV